MAAAIDTQIQLRPISVGSDGLVTSTDPSLSQDLERLNHLAKHLAADNFPSSVPPPPQAVPNPRSNQINKAKEEGNAAYKKGEWQKAIQLYGASAALAASRPVYQASVYAREELALALANRSAAYMGAQDYQSALNDAEAVIRLKRPWTKGHFRKGKALAALGRLHEARQALAVGLEFEPKNEDLKMEIEEIDKSIKST